MKLLRSELDSEFQNTLFEMSVNELPDRGVQYFDSKVTCTLSSKKIQFGYELSGVINAEPTYECVRCLTDFHHPLKLPIRWWLTGDENFQSEEGTDIIHFPHQSDSIELNDAIGDIIGLAEPIKPICKESCNGLCSQCGINLNSNSCECAPSDGTNPWDVLKNFNIEKN